MSSGLTNGLMRVAQVRAASGGPTGPAVAARQFSQFVALLLNRQPKVVLAANPNRMYFLIQNKTPQSFYVGIGPSVDEDGGVEVAPGGSLDLEFAPTEQISIYGLYADQPALIVEGRYA